MTRKSMYERQRVRVALGADPYKVPEREKLFLTRAMMGAKAGDRWSPLRRVTTAARTRQGIRSPLPRSREGAFIKFFEKIQTFFVKPIDILKKV